MAIQKLKDEQECKEVTLKPDTTKTYTTKNYTVLKNTKGAPLWGNSYYFKGGDTQEVDTRNFKLNHMPKKTKEKVVDTNYEFYKTIYKNLSTRSFNKEVKEDTDLLTLKEEKAAKLKTLSDK